MPGWYVDLQAACDGRDPFLLFLEYAGTFAGAISGVRLASARRFDWFGAYVIGCITALGGGTLRDILLNIQPFWIDHIGYHLTCFAAVVIVWIFGKRVISEQVTWFIFDTVTIALFTVLGLEKSLSYGMTWWCAVMMGVITAVFGGVIRDICIAQVPLIFRKEIYALACLAGGIFYVVLWKLGLDTRVCALVCSFVIFSLRALSIHYHLGAPILHEKGMVHYPHSHGGKEKGGAR